MRWDGPPPYLGPWELISLAWIRASIIALLIIGFALWIGATTAVEGIQDAKNALTEACQASEKVATVAANLPNYAAEIVNDQINAAIIDSIQAAHKALELLLEAMTAIVRYFLQVVNGIITFVFQFIIGGILSVIADFTAAAQRYLNTVVGGIADGIQSSINNTVSGVNSAIDVANRAISSYNSIPFVPDISLISHVSINFDVSQIRNFQVPNTVSSSITALSSRLPNLDSLINSIDTTIGGPVQALERDMNATFANITVPNVNITLPQVGAVQYCNKLNVGFLDELGNDILWAMHVGLGILAGLALIIFLAHAFFIWIMWRIQLRGDASASAFWSQAGTTTKTTTVAAAAPPMSEKKPEGVHEEPEASTSKTPASTYPVIPLTRHNILALDNPFSTWAAAKVLSFFSFLHPSQVAHDRLAWLFAYIFSIHPLICFVIGLFGVVALALQLILINIVRGRINREVGKIIDDVVDAVGGAVNALISNVGGEVASGLNTALGGIDTAINQDLNGWISTAVGTYANAMRSFYTTLTNGITNTFSGSFLETPMRALVQTIVGDQATGLSDAQTYLQQNLHISVPRINSKVFLISNGTLDEISDTLARAAIGGNGNQGVFGLIFDRYTQLLKNLMVLFGGLLAIWAFIVLMGLVILLMDIIRHPHAGKVATKEEEATTQPEISEKAPVKKETEEPIAERDVGAAATGESPAPIKQENDVETGGAGPTTSAPAADPPVTKSSGKGLRRFLPFLSHNARTE